MNQVSSLCQMISNDSPVAKNVLSYLSYSRLVGSRQRDLLCFFVVWLRDSMLQLRLWRKASRWTRAPSRHLWLKVNPEVSSVNTNTAIVQFKHERKPKRYIVTEYIDEQICNINLLSKPP